MTPLTGKTALLAGASRGLGRGVADAFLAADSLETDARAYQLTAGGLQPLPA